MHLKSFSSHLPLCWGLVSLAHNSSSRLVSLADFSVSLL